MPHNADQFEGLPPLTYEDVRWRWTVEAMIACMGRKRGERFLRLLVDRARTEVELETVLPIRRHASHVAIMREKRKAAASISAYLPTLRASLPPE